jgi:hypothetical protein
MIRLNAILSEMNWHIKRENDRISGARELSVLWGVLKDTLPANVINDIQHEVRNRRQTILEGGASV